ncbi:hypothetical protein HDU87_002010 [Geranomyces variabilis]|uniref:AAA+ ATPase domain-containing protein n=1 Tax=Geranomyces variabilis TaxID=109894 RepID=A0AAD5XNL3_9FUNG|nr:hypothetical protein HDU87_002010 [Geranomyces variabilis]
MHSATSWDLARFRQTVRNAIAQEGSLRPVVDLLTSGQLQAMLLAWIPSRYGDVINTGIYAVDMFVTMLIVTMLVSALSFVGTWVDTHILSDSNQASDTSTSVRVEHYRLDKWGETVVNVHYEALAWLISERSRNEDHGDFRMVPYESEMGNNCGDSDDDDYWIPKFNILPRGVRPLLIKHEDCFFEIKFEQSENENADSKPKATTSAELRKKVEPPVLIRRAVEVEQRKDAQNRNRPQPTIDFMQRTLAEITKLYLAQLNERKTRARYMRSQDGGWYWSSEIYSSRGLDSVALDKQQEAILLRDLTSFHDDKPFYVRMGLPYRRGYLFSGPPGTGKTSLINAISATYNRDIYYMNLKEIADDAALQSAFDSVPRNCILVFEDIDAQSGVVHSRERRSALRELLVQTEERERREKREARQRKRIQRREKKLAKKKRKEETGVSTEGESDDDTDVQEVNDGLRTPVSMLEETDASSVAGKPDVNFGDLKFPTRLGPAEMSSVMGRFTLSTLLNCMDGHTLANGTIIVMTSNHPEVLDPALIRPGRIDLHLHLSYCTRYQMQKMFRSVMDDATAEPDFSSVDDHVIAPCDALRIMILYRHAPEHIPAKLKERCSEILSGNVGMESRATAGTGPSD